MTAAFQGLSVLDLSDRYSGAWCSRLLADFGADVIMRDPSPVRELGPFDDAGASIPAAYVLAGKRSIEIELDATALKDLIASVDVLIDSFASGSEAAALFEHGALQELNPALVHCQITPHGLEGERAELPGNDLTADALSGWASVNGLQPREPIKSSGYQASYQAGTMALNAIVAALIHREKHGGEGQFIDLAETDVLVHTFAPGYLRSQYQGAPWRRREVLDMTAGPVPVADGHFSLTISRPHFWVNAMKVLGLPKLAEDENLQNGLYRATHKEEFSGEVEGKLLEWNKADLFKKLGDLRVIAGPVLTMDELAGNEHFLGRDFFVTPDDQPDVRYPGAPFKMSETPWALQGVAPKAGADTAEVLSSTPTLSARMGGAPKASEAETGGPLQGYRGVVLTQAWAGTLTTQILGLLGAEIIQVEAVKRMDSWRGTLQGQIPKELQNRKSAKHPWNVNPLFNSVNLNKQSATLDLATDEGVETFKGLVAEADFVAENFSPRVMGNLGIDYEALRDVREDVILCSLSAYGNWGPWSHVPGIGGTIEPTAGMSALLGYRDGPPMNSGQMYPDAVAGLLGASAILTALFHRERTGTGQYIDLSMQEANFSFVGDAWLQYEMTGEVRARQGNESFTLAPHGIYPTRGDDQWIAIAAENDESWASLCDISGHAEWTDEFGDRAARKANEEKLNASVARWTKDHDKHELAATLAAAGVTAAPVLDGLEALQDPVFLEHGSIETVNHAEAGKWRQATIPFKMSKTPLRVTRPAPMKDEHSFEIFERLLGMTTERYDELLAKGVTGAPDRQPRK